MQLEEIIDEVRQQFPALSREIDGQTAAYFDGPGGTQVPAGVIDAISDYLSRCNANVGGPFATSRESDMVLDEVHQAMADFVGATDPDTIAFGPNMTTLTFALSRSLARTLQAGDEIIVTRLDHDANVSPWVLAARDAGATVRKVEIRPADCTLDMDDLGSKLCAKTRLVAVGCASNSVGTINPVKEIARLAHEVGALVFLDAVHFAPHARINVEEFECDFLACSVYKFFGPHVGVLWGRREQLERLPAYKLRPAPETLPDRWMTGTQNHEGMAGTRAAVEYLADLGRRLSGASLDRPAALDAAFAGIRVWESQLVDILLAGLAEQRDITVYGIREPARTAERLPTVAFTHARKAPAEVAESLGSRGLFVWHGDYYAIELREALGQAPQGMVRIGIAHYNTRDEVRRLLDALREI